MDSGIIKRPFKWDGGKPGMSASHAFTVPTGLISDHHNPPSDVITFVIRGAATPVLAEQNEEIE